MGKLLNFYDKVSAKFLLCYVTTKKENGATNCPILLVFTVEYRILYTKGNWIGGKNVITCYYIFLWFFQDISEITLSRYLLSAKYITLNTPTLFYSLNYAGKNTEFLKR